MSDPGGNDPGPARRGPCSSPDGTGGFSLIETMIGMLILLVVLLSVAQMFGLSVSVNKAAEDITQVTSLASEKIEEMKYRPYAQLTAGGSLDLDVAGYSDSPDLEGDGQVDYIRRWRVTDLGTHSRIEVRVISLIDSTGSTKETTVATLVAPR